MVDHSNETPTHTIREIKISKNAMNYYKTITQIKSSRLLRSNIKYKKLKKQL